jgi:putative hydrolase of the HAD superfamily
MVPIFDLDDTLYPEVSYVESGFRAVARWGNVKFGWPENNSFGQMQSILAEHGRGSVFDLWLNLNGARPTRYLVNAAVNIYRHHQPNIHLPDQNRELLAEMADRWPLYLLTDGHKIVQAKKIAALNVAHFFQGIYITHRYGLAAAKPSPRCLELIQRRTKAPWRQMVYVGDNPAKDFVTAKQLGILTIRVLTGRHSYDLAMPNFDADHKIKQLPEVATLIERLSLAHK